ncbi:MAG: D-alanyl-D-alanine carboxypeptidase [Acidimicrobiales bacterium]|jgi:D-alanyl-D-alanine carboxypeptidase (penicillin-binding protein 5/6)
MSSVAAALDGDVAAWPYARPKRSATKARQRRIFWRRRLVVLACLASLVAGLGWLVSTPGSGSLGASSAGSMRPIRVPLPSLVALVPGSSKIAGSVALLPFPSTGQSAVYVRGVGLLGATPDEASVPIASLTKVMTAVIVLRDHPLGDGSGPSFTMTAADHEQWIQAVANGDSSLEVVAGERLTERQLLEALMIPSACNIADYLARWDAGSIPAFVRKMNAMAATLGLRQTHYADASGVNPGSRSTALDQALLGSYAMTVPGMVSIEDHPDMRFPVEGLAPNYNPVVGEDGVIGLKSGFTDAAQICLVIAARRKVGDRIVLVVASTLSQPSSLQGAGDIELQLLDAATADLGVHEVLFAHEPVAKVVAGWTAKATELSVPVSMTVVGWPGMSVTTVVKASIPVRPGAGHGWDQGTKMATVEVSTPAAIEQVAPGRLNGFLPSAPLGWTPVSSSSSTTVASSSQG